MRKAHGWGLAASIFVVFTAAELQAKITGLERVATGLFNPIYATHAPGDENRLFIVGRSGAIRILDLTTNTVQSTPFLTIPSVDTAGEGGLLGMAFHPDYATNGKFYVNVTLDNGGQDFQGATSPFSTHIREYTVSGDPNIANPTPREVLSFIQPQDNHNGGWIGFSPNDGYLYIPTGDGGGGGDTGSGHTPGVGNAQDTSENFLGKILRIDVDVPTDENPDDDPPYLIPPDNPFVGVAGDDEIWAVGLRNPFRDSFDRETGDLWLGDVGQGSREEINRQPAVLDEIVAENFGWRIREGNTGGTAPANYRGPEYDYARPIADPPPPDPAITEMNQYRGTVVTGGYVYRGPDPSLDGQYFFLDSRNTAGTSDDNYWHFDIDDPVGTVLNIDDQLTTDVGTPTFPVSYGEDAAGNLYIVYLVSGDIYRIATSLPGDYNLDDVVDAADYTVWRNNLGTDFIDADGDGSGTVDEADYTIWKDHYGDTAAGAGGGGISPVPEPVAMIFVGQLAAFGLLRRRPRGKMR